MKRKRMNLKELAEKLGLSQVTVSRALNGHVDVKESTRKVVFEAAEKYNYRPNLAARKLALTRNIDTKCKDGCLSEDSEFDEVIDVDQYINMRLKELILELKLLGSNEKFCIEYIREAILNIARNDI